MYETNQALKDKRNILHQSEQKKRREAVLFKLRKKYIQPATPSREDFQHILSVMDDFCINSVSTREGRRNLKEVLNMVCQKPWDYQSQLQKIVSVSSTLLQMPINENTISLIYDTLKMLIALNQQQGFMILDELWKLIGASLKYINQQHGYLIIKICLILSGNSLTEYVCLEYLMREQCIESMFAIIFEILQSSDKAIIMESIWLMNNLHQFSRLNVELHARVVRNMMHTQLWELFTKFADKYSDDQEFMKELLWLGLLVTKSNPCLNAQNMAMTTISRINLSHDKSLLISLMILTQLSSQGYTNVQLVMLLGQIYSHANTYSQREIIVCLANMFTNDHQCRVVFLGTHHWQDIVLHSLQFYQLDSMYLICNLVNNFDMAYNLLKSNPEIITTLRNIQSNTNLPETMIQTFRQIIF